MGYDEGLAERIRAILAGTPGLEEKKMFGGLAFTINGHIAASAYRDGGLMITCPHEETAELLAEAGASAMMRGGKAMAGWVLVGADAVADDEALQRWVSLGRETALAKPPK